MGPPYSAASVMAPQLLGALPERKPARVTIRQPLAFFILAFKICE